MNNWMSEPFAPLTKAIDRGKVLSAQDLAKVGEFARYKDSTETAFPTAPCRHRPPARHVLHPRHRPHERRRTRRSEGLEEQHRSPGAEVRHRPHADAKPIVKKMAAQRWHHRVRLFDRRSKRRGWRSPAKTAHNYCGCGLPISKRRGSSSPSTRWSTWSSRTATHSALSILRLECPIAPRCCRAFFTTTACR